MNAQALIIQENETAIEVVDDISLKEAVQFVKEAVPIANRVYIHASQNNLTRVENTVKINKPL